MENTNNATSGNLFPEIGSAFHFGWNVLKAKFIPLLLVIIVVILISGLGSALFHREAIGLGFLAMLYGVFVSGPISFGENWVFLKAVRNEEFEVKDIFSVFGPHYWETVLASLLLTVIIVLGILLFVVPGIIFACRLAFVPYLVIDKNEKATDAISKSWEMTKGFGWKLFAMGIFSFFIGLGGIILFIVGIFPAVIWIYAAFAAFYHAVDSKFVRVIEV